MEERLQPIKIEKLRDIVMSRIEDRILSGKLSVGEKLPTECELSKQLGVSRPVVHEGLVELERKGLITMKSRHGSVVNDYRMHGSITLLQSLMGFDLREVKSQILESMWELRMMMEVESARRAAERCTPGNLNALHQVLKKEAQVDCHDQNKIAELFFDFHQHVVLASENIVYALIFNSFRVAFVSGSIYFSKVPQEILSLFKLHKKLVQAIEEKDARLAEKIMSKTIIDEKDIFDHHLTEHKDDIKL